MVEEKHDMDEEVDPVIKSSINALRTWKIRRSIMKGKNPSPPEMKNEAMRRWPDLTDEQRNLIVRIVRSDLS